jgi:hypothetical protein
MLLSFYSPLLAKQRCYAIAGLKMEKRRNEMDKFPAFLRGGNGSKHILADKDLLTEYADAITRCAGR